jgi:hypothetical protein
MSLPHPPAGSFYGANSLLLGPAQCTYNTLLSEKQKKEAMLQAFYKQFGNTPVTEAEEESWLKQFHLCNARPQAKHVCMHASGTKQCGSFCSFG